MAIYGTTAPQFIDRTVEETRKNRMSLIDGMELLCRMRGLTSYVPLVEFVSQNFWKFQRTSMFFHDL